MFTGLLVALSSGIESILGGPAKLGKVILGQSMSSGSIARLTHATTVEPITLIDDSLEMSDRLDSTMELVVNIYASIYSRALSTKNTTVSGAQIIKRLESLNPTNTSMRGTRLALGLENLGTTEHPMDVGLRHVIDPVSVGDIPDPQTTLAVEALGDGKTPSKDASQANTPTAVTARQASRDIFKDKPELSFGKVVEFELTADGKTLIAPVSFRLNTSMVDSPAIINAMLARFKSDETALERRVKWRSGSITSLTEMLFCTDLVRQDFKNMINDKSGVYRKLRPAAAGEYTRALLRGEVSVAQASNVLVISKATADQVEGRSGGRFEDEAFRQRMLEATGIMILVILDPVADIATIYIESLARGQRVNGRSLVSASKKNGPDIESILAVLTTGRGNLI